MSLQLTNFKIHKEIYVISSYNSQLFFMFLEKNVSVGMNIHPKTYWYRKLNALKNVGVILIKNVEVAGDSAFTEPDLSVY